MAGWIEASTSRGTIRLNYAELVTGPGHMQELLQDLYRENATLLCMCKPERPVRMHIRRYQTRPPAYCLVTNPRGKHAPDCPRFFTHIFRFPSIPESVQTSTTSATPDPAEAVYANWERSTFYVPSLQELNPAQQEAARHTDGPCMVIAAAGSGKTAVLIARIQYLIESGVDPRSILACTFTRKATDEMRTRLVDVVGRDAAKQVTIGTMHAVAYRMLKSFLKDDWKVAADPTWLMDTVLSEPSNLNPHGVGPLYASSQEALTNVSRAKAEALMPEQVQDNTLAKVYAAYEALKAERHILDFDDMLLHVLRFFKTNSDFRDRWRRRWRYVLVDEFQDTNYSQWLFLLELVRNTRNLFVIGDDFQAIYGFRGSRPDLMFQFQKEFPDARKIVLDINYRSHDLILELAGRVIALNRGHQIEKRVHAAREVSEDTSTAEIITTKSDWGEAKFVAEEIARLHERYPRIPWSEYAILYRTNVQSRAYEEALAEQDIPYQVVGDKHFYENRDVKTLLDYLRVTIDHSDPATWIPLLNRPRRFIPKQVVDEVKAGGWEAVMAHPKCRSFRETVEELSRYENPAEALRWLVQTHPTVVRQQDDDEPVTWVDALIRSASRYKTVPEFLWYVDWVIEKSRQPKDDAVQLMTIHKSKGLEWWTVFVVDLVEGILPHRKSLSGPSLREETRLCYVAITRAKENLYLMAAQQYGGEPVELSRYLRVLQE
ncbi:ATP-dependent helicase [Alicyclobacillus macrosporangiidus]|uniref:DNA 3'-5' helicase n=1 Tax=Alicyclobacillus macrosporangiidus TaxID=392015 RepID=A0A1I7KCI7_9BACL|nr:ATP-dependent helicase [Alicyclobacillus macrosporangiidus]SFU95164.1 DNA helicase-2 / ATP-dependent DNA helicase PcrA [Alicyclobacillus macrosporangiidus]